MDLKKFSAEIIRPQPKNDDEKTKIKTPKSPVNKVKIANNAYVEVFFYL